MVNWEKSDLELSSRIQYLGILIDTSLEVFPSEAWLSRFWDAATSFLTLCHPCQCQASDLHFTGSEPDGMEAGCVPASLGPSVSLCHPPVCLGRSC